MPIHKPGKVLLHHIPLKFVRSKVAGGGGKSVNLEIPLVPFIDFLIVLVVFLLMSFSASGELVAQQPSITMPDAHNTETLEIAPILAIDDRVVTLDGNRVADTQTLASSPDASDPIPQLEQGLETLQRNWQTLHPGQDFQGMVIVQADQEVDWLVLKKVMLTAARAGYANVSFAVNQVGGE